MNQRGFIQLSLMMWVGLAVAVVVIGLGIALKVVTSQLSAVKHEYAAYQNTVKVLGDAQIAKNAQTAKDSKRINDDKVKSLETRLAATRAAADKLRVPGPRRSGVPAIPDTAPVADNAARDSRLLEVLRLAQEQSDQLVALQEWAAEQAKLRP